MMIQAKQDECPALQMKGALRIQYKCLFSICIFPEMKQRGLVISKTEL